MYNGNGFLWSNISVYVLSYLYIFDDTVRADAIFAVDVGMSVCNAFGNLFGTYLLNVKRISPKVVILIGVSISIPSIIASSYVKRLDLFIILFGFVNSFGSGMNYFIPVICGWEYFPQHKGRVSGLNMCAFGMSGFFLNLISTALVNPRDEKALIYISKDLSYFERNIAMEVPLMLRYLCCIFAVLTVLAVSFISRPNQIPKP